MDRNTILKVFVIVWLNVQNDFRYFEDNNKAYFQILHVHLQMFLWIKHGMPELFYPGVALVTQVAF